jgi:hypothetical protein
MKLPFAEGARFNSEKRCIEETRLLFLDEIGKWAENGDPSSPKALVLFGQAGTGKSSIANEIAKRFDDKNRLTASYCFIRGKHFNQACQFFKTLAHCLSARYPAFKASLSTVLKEKPDIHSAEDYTTLFESLIVKPLEGLQFISPVFVVIDALDECDDASRNPFHTFLGQHLSKLPANFRILMTSRPEYKISEAFPESSSVRRMRMDDPQLSSVEADIRIYMQAKLPSEIAVDDIEKLVKKAEGLFQWASVACDYIANPPETLDYDFCLKEILGFVGSNDAAEQHLDKLYNTVLKAHYKMDHSQISKNFRSVMQLVLGTFEPLSITSLKVLCPHTGGVKDVSNVVKFLGSVLSNVTSDLTLPVAPIHTSFRDFLTNKTRSKEFFINRDEAHKPLAYATLRTMEEMLQFNICKLKTSYRLNSEVPILEKEIASELSYSCRFWAEHLTHVSKFDYNLLRCIRILLEEKFLYWLEVLSLSEEFGIASVALSALRNWLRKMQDKVSICKDCLSLMVALITKAGSE